MCMTNKGQVHRGEERLRGHQFKIPVRGFVAGPPGLRRSARPRHFAGNPA
ncbi:unnamed protein product [Ectocarpus sp. 12 AP-2014]